MAPSNDDCIDFLAVFVAFRCLLLVSLPRGAGVAGIAAFLPQALALALSERAIIDGMVSSVCSMVFKFLVDRAALSQQRTISLSEQHVRRDCGCFCF